MSEIRTPYDDKISEKLKPYIFSEDEVLTEVPFSQFRSERGNRFCFGMYVPQRIIDERGTRQELKPVVITSYSKEQVPIFLEVFRPEIENLGVRLETIPGRLPKRYSLVSVPKWLHKQAPEINGKELFSEIKGTYEEFLFFSPEWYRVHAFWDLSTYFFTLFPAFPYLELRGLKGAAKTKVMRVSRCFSFNAERIMTNPTEANLFRIVHEVRPTLYLDECESFFQERKGRVEADARLEIINSGYTSDGLVPRQEQEGKKWVTKYFSTYCPKVLASINGLQGATESRAIVHVMTKAPDNDPRGEKDIDGSEKKYMLLRDKCLFFALQNWERVLEEYKELDAQKTGLKKRNSQLWRPLLAVAKVIDPDEYEKLRKFAQQQQGIAQNSEIGEDSWEEHILKRIVWRVQNGETQILLKDLADAIPTDKKPSSRAVGRIADRLGFRDVKAHFEQGNGYEIFSIANLRLLCGDIINKYISSYSSVSSREPETPEIKVTETQILNIPEEKGDFLNITPEDTDVIDVSDECREGVPEKNMFRQTPEKLLKKIISLYNQTKKPVPFEELEKEGFSELGSWLDRLKEKGELIESKPGAYLPL